MSGHRHAASILFGVSTIDQEAVLADLPAADRQVLRGHLDELTALGFDPDTMRAAGAVSNPDTNRGDTSAVPAAKAAVVLATPVEQIRAASVTALASVLNDEPVTLVADLLAIQSWPWSVELKAALPAATRIGLRLMAARPSPAAELQILLMKELAQALAVLPVNDGAAVEIIDQAGAVSQRSLIGKLSHRIAAWMQ